jgi:SNARE domain
LKNISSTLLVLPNNLTFPIQPFFSCRMLDDLEQNVDRSETKMSNAMRSMRKFLRDSEDSKSNWCIMILVIVLMALLLAVILV